MAKEKFSKEDAFKSLRDAPKIPLHGSKPKIQRVPFMLRDHKNFEKYYEPRAVAIGPFHHNSPRCELSQKYKLRLTSKFVEFTNQKDEDLYKKIEEKIKELRECYVEEATKDIDDEPLAWMLFLDGCSTLQFIYSSVHTQLEELFKIKRDQIAIAQQDLFLLENQVPYQVLVLLMSSSEKCKVLKESIESFVRMHNNAQTTEQEQNQQLSGTKTKEEEPTHLLDLLRTRMLGSPKKNNVQEVSVPVSSTSNVQEVSAPVSSTGNVTDDVWKWVSSLFRRKKEVTEFSGQSFRNVKELDAAGINFKPSKNNFLNISFTSQLSAGWLSLPPISVDDSTGPKFMNLIAYEMCPDFQNDYGVTSYIGFLDALIDHADDVKKLRSAGVLSNLLGSDEEVAKLFNEIGTDLVPNTDIYLNVKAEIEKHYKNKWKTWMSQFYTAHFSSPWTVLAFFGVLLALGLSGIQTWAAVNPQPTS